MQYILIILGLILIYLSARNNSANIHENKNSDNEFSNVLEGEVLSNEIDILKNQYKEILGRIDEIESSIILLNEQIEESNENCFDNKPNFNEENPNISSENFDNYVEEDINSIIFQLSDDGKDLDEICSSLKLGKGEVLLRLGLRK